MSFDQEMEQFFKEFSDSARKRAEANFFYQKAVERKDVIAAQSLAIDLIFKDLPRHKEWAAMVRPTLDIDRKPQKKPN